MTHIRPRHGLACAVALIITLLLTMTAVPHASAQQQAAAQQESFALDIRMIGKGSLIGGTSIKVCKDRSYTIHAWTKRIRGESFVPNTQITVLPASLGTISPSSGMSGVDRPYDPAVFRYKATEEGTETLRFTGLTAPAPGGTSVDRTVSFTVEDCVPTVSLLWRGTGVVTSGPGATAQYVASVEPVELIPVGDAGNYVGTGTLVYHQLTAQSVGCYGVASAAPAPVDITAREVSEDRLDITFTFTPAVGSLTVSGSCTNFTVDFTMELGSYTGFSQASVPARGGTVHVPVSSQPDPILHVSGTMIVTVKRDR